MSFAGHPTLSTTALSLIYREGRWIESTAADHAILRELKREG